ncbi:hypothetical protein Gbro_2402 [Gordonia bronchialis DSM 43247]|uniref:TPM domain-containing protein n=1 Tax=Gordonia bronchialis (strain ATCC 25592 / DSM 43247 / BCRC 13721 / JCM 3198 / KCTC 3076 / NBRC 16047 / NCTC 10667) TaxID=526226 RepID=D0LDM1_GORB4|nr:DUF6676 family protein [Gordonia bronchialis]ACY21644.1 hypothetical protein Gbro_2402 [Gordonia bronchialis DSM 43247]MCC3324432.1 hypothetical protein [Gordonia bronchialis]QGS24726.1 hypothetical protein FOB84_11775 [Gordonia bronchialis]STQ64531.1 Uncharacterised protein [Gordonia bronchialis]
MSPDPLVPGSPGTQAGDTDSPSIPGLTNVDMKQLATDLAADHVAAPSNPDQVPALLAVVADAKAKGHDISLVVLADQQPNYWIYRDIATTLQHDVGGTVIVLGPNSVGSTGPDFSRFVQEQATNNLDLKQPAVAARQMVDQMTAPTLDWTVITLVLIVVVVVGAVIGRLRSLRQRRSRDVVATALATETPAVDGAARTERVDLRSDDA